MPNRPLTYLLAVLIFLLTSCQGQAPQPTENQNSLAEADLAGVALQQSELPDEFATFSIESTDTIFTNVPSAHTGLANSIVTLFRTEENRKVFSNGILVFKNEELAKAAYQGILAGIPGDKRINASPLGDETSGMYDVITSPTIANQVQIAMILWRSGEAVAYLSASDSDDTPARDQMQTLAAQIQERIAAHQE